MYNVATSRNTSESLAKFGVGDCDVNLMAVLVCPSVDNLDELENTLSSAIQGNLVNIAEHEKVIDIKAIANANRLKVLEPSLSKDLVHSLLVTRTAIKDLI